MNGYCVISVGSLILRELPSMPSPDRENRAPVISIIWLHFVGRAALTLIILCGRLFDNALSAVLNTQYLQFEANLYIIELN